MRRSKHMACRHCTRPIGLFPQWPRYVHLHTLASYCDSSGTTLAAP